MHDSDRPIVQLLVKKWQKMTVTLETRFNEVPRDWENVFIILRVCYIEHLHWTIKFFGETAKMFATLR